MTTAEQISLPSAFDKYKAAGQIASETVAYLISKCTPGSSIENLCNSGDEFARAKLNSVFTGKLEHGKNLAFPTCISKNEIAGYSRDGVIIDGDLLKIELGVHIDGFPAVLCTTHFVGNSLSKTDPRTMVLTAAATASKEVLNVLRTSNRNLDMVKVLEKVAVESGCQLTTADISYPYAPGVITYQMSQNVIDGHNDDDDDDTVHRLILVRGNSSYDFNLRELDFEDGEVYGVDIAFSTGTGKLQPVNMPIAIMKRDHEKFEQLKFKGSHQLIGKLKNEHFPLEIMNFVTDPQLRLGLRECSERKLLVPYPVMTEKSGEYVARIKFTVVIKGDKPRIIAAVPSQPELDKIKS